MPDEGLEILDRLARRCVVGIISGRDLEDLRGIVRAEHAWLAGSHGMELRSPEGVRTEVEAATRFLPVLDDAANALDDELASVPNAWVERKRFAVAVHFRQVDEARVPEVAAIVDQVGARYADLRKTFGKRILELRPDIDWDKGSALWWLFEQAGLQPDTAVPIYIGDDLTDEDAFAALGDRGLGILVYERGRLTAADYRVADTEEVYAFLSDLVALLERAGP
jgi:trehalose-phosphatase